MHRTIRISLLRIMLLLLAGSAWPASMCAQQFTVYGKTAGEHSLLFWDMYMTPECHFWTTHICFTGGDYFKDVSNVMDTSGSDWYQPILEHTPLEKMIVIDAIDGSIDIDDTISVFSPPYDSAFTEQWREWWNLGDPMHYWELACSGGDTCNVFPEFVNAEAELMYKNGEALYKNYLLQTAYYFPESGYVVLTTYQPLEGMRADRLHGLLIYRLR